MQMFFWTLIDFFQILKSLILAVYTISNITKHTITRPYYLDQLIPVL